MTHEPIHSDPSYARDLRPADPALVNQPGVITERIRLYTDWVLCQALQDTDWTFGAPAPEQMATWLLSNPIWKAEREAYSPRTKEQILKGIMQVLVDYQKRVIDGETPVVANFKRKKADAETKKRRVFRGISLGIEHPEGSIRRGTAPDGTSWERTMVHDYGHFVDIDAADGDSLDCYVGPCEDSDLVFVVNQQKADGTFDEHKVLLGFSTADEALKGYLAHMPDGWTSFDPPKTLSIGELRHWLNTGSQMAKMASALPPEAQALVDDFESLGARVSLYGDAKALTLAAIVLPKEKRGEGLGSQFMQRLTSIADDLGATLFLTPSTDFGATSVARLRRFYSQFGFTRNTGRNKDFRSTDGMVRQPRSSGKIAATSPVVDTPAFKSWFSGSKVVNSDGTPKVVYHGTTHTFDRFDPSKGDEEGYYGAALYFTDDHVDVGSNYSNPEGPDVTNRVERRYEAILNELEQSEEDADPDTLEQRAKEQARTEILGEHGGTVYLTFLRMVNPVIVKASGGTRFEGGHYTAKDDWVDGRDLKRIYAALQKLMQHFSVWRPDETLGSIMERLDVYEGFTAYELETAIRGCEELYDVPGGPGPVVAKLYQLLGFDGVIMDASAQFKTMKMGPGTRHYIVWKPTQVKSALGNVGTFNRRSPRLVASLQRTAAIPELAGTKVVWDGKPLKVFHGTASEFQKFKQEFVGQNFGDAAGYFFTNNTSHDVVNYGDRLEVVDDSTSAGAYANHAKGPAGPNIIPAYINLKNPLIIDGDQDSDILSAIETRTRPAGDFIRDEVIGQGYDGLMVIDRSITFQNGQPEILVVATHPDQIIPAVGRTASVYDNYCPICGQAGCGGRCVEFRKKASPELAHVVHALGHSGEALQLLGPLADTFTAGGCWVFAEALRRNLPGSQLVALKSERSPVEHVALAYKGDLYDADGAFTRAQMIQKLQREFGVATTVTPLNPGETGEVTFDATVADKLSEAFASTLAGIIHPQEYPHGRQPGASEPSPKDLQREAVGAIPFHQGPSDNPGDDQPSWTFQAKSGGDGGSLRVLGAASRQVWALSPATKQHLAAVGVTSPDLHELEPGEVSGRVFAQAVLAAKAANPYGAAVSPFDPADYPGARLFLSPDGMAGIALTPEGDRCGAFVHPKGPKGAMATMFSLAASQGGMTGDCFDTILPDYYSRHGARVVARLAWNDDYAPKDWDKARFAEFNNGEPDVVFTVFDPDNAQLYRAGDGVRVATYEEGKRVQADAVREILARRRARKAGTRAETGSEFDARLKAALGQTEHLGEPRVVYSDIAKSVTITLGESEVAAHIIPERSQAIVGNLVAVPQSAGIGTRLMLALCDWCKEHGIRFITGVDVSDYGASGKIRQKLPGTSVNMSRADGVDGDKTGADIFPDAPDSLKAVLRHWVPDKGGQLLVTRLASALRTAALETDGEIGSGEHAATTDATGRFWGDAGAGCVFHAKSTGRILLSYRSEFVNEPHCWGVWGGAIDNGEAPQVAAEREVREETSYHGPMSLREAYVYSNGDFRYTTFIAEVTEEFVPKLNWEAEGYEWFRIEDLPDNLHFGLKEALPAIETKLGEAVKTKTAATYTIPPKLLPYVKAQGGLDAARQWHTKVWLGNSGTKDHTEVTFLAFDPATSTIVPIAASDEHRNGWDLIQHLEHKGLIPKLDWHILNLQLNFVDVHDAPGLQATLALFTAWRRLGAPNTAVRSRYAKPGFLVSMDDFISAKGLIPDHKDLGTVAPAGDRLIRTLEALSALYTRQHSGQPVPEKLLARAGAATLAAFEHVSRAYILSHAGMQIAQQALDSLETGGDPAEFERAIFAFDGLKNQVHAALRAYGQNQFKDDDLEDTFGDCKLALQEFDRLGAAPPVKQASEPDTLDLPEIQWAEPTDAELMKELETEPAIEKLFIRVNWPSAEDLAHALKALKASATVEQLDPYALAGRHLWRSYDDLRKTVTSFGAPKNPDSMLEAIKAGRPLPMPVVVRHRDGGLEVVGGNTRSGIAALAGQPIQALVIDEKAAGEQLAQRLLTEIQQKWPQEPELFAAIKAYYLEGGPAPVVTREQGAAAYCMSAVIGDAARVLGIESRGQDIRLRPTQEEAVPGEPKTSALRRTVTAALRVAAEDLGLPEPVIEDFYTIAADAMQAAQAPTFEAFLAELRAGLKDKFPAFLHSAGGYTGLRPLWDAVVEHDEDDLQQSMEDLRISPRLPSAMENPGGKAREVPLEDPHGEERLQPDLATMTADPDALAFNVKLMLQYPEFRGIKDRNPIKAAEKIIEHMTDNLVWLYEHWHPDHRTRSKAWYVGGNRITHRWAKRFDVPPEAVAGILAALSPQQHWFQNVTLGERMLSALCEHADEPWDAKMTQVVLNRDWGKGGKAVSEEDDESEEESETADAKGLVKARPMDILKNLEGKSLNDLDDGTPNGLYLMALWVRAYDEAHNPNACRNVSPEGEFGDWYRTLDGKPVANRWQSFGAVMKAIQIFKNPTVRNISDLIGANHKVRSFYNNLIAPLSSGGDVTIDTHAVAAALVRPLSASSIPVAHNFGSGKPAVKAVRYRAAYVDKHGKTVKERKAKPGTPAVPGPTSSNITGITGLYGFYAEAYRRAAAKVGIQPREMQSITWEAVRGLFKPAQKRDKDFAATADNFWRDYSAGTTDKQTTRENLLGLAGGVDTPEWAVANPRNAEGERHSSYSGELSGALPPGGGSKSPARSRTRTRTPGRAASGLRAAQVASLFLRHRSA